MVNSKQSQDKKPLGGRSSSSYWKVNIVHIEHNTEYLNIKILIEAIEKHHSAKKLYKTLEFLLIKRLRFRIFNFRKTEILPP